MARPTSWGRSCFDRSGAQVIALNVNPDGRNINAGCGSLHPEGLQKRVVAEKAAMGAAFDGDADRAILVTANGDLVDGDAVMLAQARYMKSQGQLKAGRVIGTTMSNLGLEHALRGRGAYARASSRGRPVCA